MDHLLHEAPDCPQYVRHIIMTEQEELEALYGELAAQGQALANWTGLACPADCGQCCRKASRNIECTPFEMRAIAQEFWSRGEGPAMLEKARSAGDEGWCVLHNGRCGEYDYRPLVCRLFGFSGLPDKYGHLRLTASGVMEDTSPDMVRRARSLVDSDQAKAREVLPLNTEWMGRVLAIAPPGEQDIMGVNRALAMALEREGLRRQYSEPAHDFDGIGEGSGS